jgi:xylan 1,4-beta-xylosidase
MVSAFKRQDEEENNMDAGTPVRAFKWNRLLCLLLVYQLAVSAVAQTLVLPGDHPDPSVVKIGNSYWASATTSNWAPAFPLLQSNDLIHWQQQ